MKVLLVSPGLWWPSDLRAAPSAAVSLGYNSPGTAPLGRNVTGLPDLIWGQHSPPGTVPVPFPQPHCDVAWPESHPAPSQSTQQ